LLWPNATGNENRSFHFHDEGIVMATVPIASTVLVTVDYDSRTQVLQLEFRDRTIYCYRAVPMEVHQALLRAPSKGTFFNRVIRGKFETTQRTNSLS
jgi:hypothetical protein